MNDLAILYSFRRCPYAMRARLALHYAQRQVELREVELSQKPEAMLKISPKGTVPVLQLAGGKVIEESREIVLWALNQNDPHHLLDCDMSLANQLIDECDGEFKKWLDCYKYFDRYPEHSRQYYRQQAEVFIEKLENLLKQHVQLLSNKISVADICIMPFIRQFVFVDKEWFENSKYQHLLRWLTSWLESPDFFKIMEKYPPWQKDEKGVLF